MISRAGLKITMIVLTVIGLGVAAGSTAVAPGARSETASSLGAITP
jgi:hypothetical protein